MPLASLFALQFYGPACAALVSNDAIGVLESATPVRELRPSLTVVGTGDAPLLRPFRGYAAALDVSGNAYTALTPHQYKKISLIVNVGAVPSAFDITQAVLNALASDYNNPGTIGSKINASGAGGDPWSDPRALTVPKFLGLK